MGWHGDTVAHGPSRGMTSLFISYSSDDRMLASTLADRLRRRGYESLFVDFDADQGIPAGVRWEDALYARLRRADGVIFLGTASSAGSKWCFAELAMARFMGKSIVPLAIAGSTLPALLADTQRTELKLSLDSQQPPNDAIDPAGLEHLWTALERLGLPAWDSFAWDPRRAPFPGLAAFGERDAAAFFGREQETRELLERLERPSADVSTRLTAVIGASGSGKSSLVRAGVMPRLRRMNERWIVVPSFAPAEAPEELLSRRLASALTAAGAPRDWKEVRRALAGGGPALTEIARDLTDATDAHDARVLLVVDQAEELLTRTAEDERREFLRLLVDALAPGSPLLVVATLRGEFLGPLLEQPELAEMLREPYALAPLSPAGMADAIRGPARLVDLEFEADLVERMVRETGGGEALPLLAFALRKLHDAARAAGASRVTEADYAAIGGVVGALRTAANAVADDVSASANGDAVVDTLLHLVDIRPEAEPTRRRVKRSTFTTEAENEIVDAFTQARLLSSDKDNGEPVVTVTHEALLHEWPPLRAAIATRRSELDVDPLELRAREWANTNHDPSFLLRGRTLLDAEETIAGADEQRPFSRLAHEFVEASGRRRRRRSRSVLAATATALLVSIMLAVVALVQRNEALQSRELLERCQAETAITSSVQQNRTVTSRPGLARARDVPPPLCSKSRRSR